MAKIFKLTIIAIFVGLLSGVLSAAFLYSLNSVTSLRHSYPYLIFALPLFGFLFSLVLKRIPHDVNQGVPYILEELDNEKARVSPWMTPFIFFSSLGTHLFEGSAGREGVGVIMGASAAHLLPKFNFEFKSLRRFLIYSGIAAGFSSIFGTPIAAVLFAFELYGFKHIKQLDLLLCTIVASFIGLIAPHFLGIIHQQFEVTVNMNEVVPYVLMAGIVSGLGAHFFYWGLKGYTKLIAHFIPHLGAKLFIGSAMICVLVYFTNGHVYTGIGSDVIAKSFTHEMSYYDFVMKALLTIMTLSIGFKGGEVTPLFFMGASLSNWAGSVFNLRNFSLSSSLGMVAIFGAVTGTPFASAVMGCELFGWRVGVICLGSCWIARLVMGKRSVYRH